MINKALALTFLLLTVSPVVLAQEPVKQLIVPLAEGGFVAFKSETNWTEMKKGSPELQRVPAVLGSQALPDDNRIIHRVLKDAGGRFIFGYDLWVAPNAAAKQFRIVVRPIDPEYESKLRAGNPGAGEPPQSEIISTFPKTTEPQTLDDGDAFSLDLLVNQNTGVKIVDVVEVTFDRATLKQRSPRNTPRDFTLDAVELAMKNYRLLINDNVVGTGKSANGFTGTLLWFYVQDRGRFIVSLVPRAGYEFQKVGIIEDNRIEFTVGNNRYEWLSSSPILPGGGTWNLWVLPDPNYSPMFGSDEVLAQKKNIFDKLDDVVNNAQNEARVRSQNLTLRNNKEVQKTRPIPRPRVMVGGADRIENLWPKNP